MINLSWQLVGPLHCTVEHEKYQKENNSEKFTVTDYIVTLITLLPTKSCYKTSEF